MPNNFSFILNRLVEVNGNASKLTDEQNYNDLFEYEVDKDDDQYTGNEDSSTGVADGDGSLDHLNTYQYTYEPTYYEVDKDKEEGEDKFEGEDLPIVIDDETALHISHRHAINHDGPYDNNNDEVAQSQSLY
jgi:hypothetical protein